MVPRMESNHLRPRLRRGALPVSYLGKLSDLEQTGAGASRIDAVIAENVMRQYAREAMDGIEPCAPEDYAARVDMICAWAYASMIEDRKALCVRKSRSTSSVTPFIALS
jgi:hypothetical protein